MNSNLPYYKRYIRNLEQNLKLSGIKTRPNASHGLWVGFLLPITLFICLLKYNTSHVFMLAFVHSVGFIITSFLFTLFTSITQKNLTGYNDIILPSILTTLIYSVMQYGIIYSILSGLVTNFVFKHILVVTLQCFPLSFTLGEALLFSKVITLFLFTTFINLYDSFSNAPVVEHEIITLILQTGLLFVIFTVYSLYTLDAKENIPKFCLIVGISCSIMILILHILLKTSPILWILNFITSSPRIFLITYWAVISLICILAVNRQINYGNKASTSTRKIFHILSCAVYIPGLIYDYNLIYLASGIALAALIILETIRVSKLGWLSDTLDDGFLVFCDEKDVGGTSFTPIYLLLGMAAPLFLHPNPFSDPAKNLPSLLSGVLSIGIGDTAASFVGSRYGRLKWPNSPKSVEGTIANFMSQLIMVVVFFKLGIIKYSLKAMFFFFISILMNSMVEAKTNQVDNLTLPLITFAILVLI